MESARQTRRSTSQPTRQRHSLPAPPNSRTHRRRPVAAVPTPSPVSLTPTKRLCQANRTGLHENIDDDAISPAPTQIHELEGHSNVSRPPPPPRLRHLSELIDPADLPVDAYVRTPSGNLLAPEQFLVHPDRPRSLRERQEDIREKVRAASRLGVQVETAQAEAPKEKVSCFVSRQAPHGAQMLM